LARIGAWQHGNKIFFLNKRPCFKDRKFPSHELVQVDKDRVFPRSCLVFFQPGAPEYEFPRPHMVFLSVRWKGHEFITRAPGAHYWDLAVMGMVRYGEASDDAFHREVREELGCDITFESGVIKESRIISVIKFSGDCDTWGVPYGYYVELFDSPIAWSLGEGREGKMYEPGDMMRWDANCLASHTVAAELLEADSESGGDTPPVEDGEDNLEFDLDVFEQDLAIGGFGQVIADAISRAVVSDDKHESDPFDPDISRKDDRE